MNSESSQNVIDYVYLRDYSKVVFFYPLFFTSLVLFIMEIVAQDQIRWLGFFWVIIFFMNLFVIAFDVSSSKFFVIILLITAIVLVILFMVVPNVEVSEFKVYTDYEATIFMTSNFYLSVTIVLGIILFIAFLNTRINYWRIERNEAYHKQGLFHNADRYPIAALRMKKDISDVFEFFLLRAGSITLNFGKKDIFHLNTILNINKKAHMLDYLLNLIKVEIDDLG
ncbi:MAG: hypothetical protein ACTSR8_11155 [Promethearchaeota archaeon]